MRYEYRKKIILIEMCFRRSNFLITFFFKKSILIMFFFMLSLKNTLLIRMKNNPILSHLQLEGKGGSFNAS